MCVLDLPVQYTPPGAATGARLDVSIQPLVVRPDYERQDVEEAAMLYIFLLYSSTEAWAASGRPDDEVLREHGMLMRELEAAGRYRTSNALGPVETATTVRVREGRTLLVDGPFAETKEQLLGYYLVDAKDLDDALAIGARIPDAAVGSVEIRPIREVEI